MSNIRQRLSSALILIAALTLALVLGKWACLMIITLLGLIIVDELYCNFFRGVRFSPLYWLNQLLYLIPFLYFNSFNDEGITYLLILITVALNLFYLFYLFFVEIDRRVVVGIVKDYPWSIGPFVFFPLVCLAKMVTFTHWNKLIIALLLVNFAMDSGAWFFGVRFGKHKLMPKVSPKKTVEGLLGGIFVATLVGAIYWPIVIDRTDPLLFVVIGLLMLGIISHLGDLVQSKFKREFQLKDSSQLIPGHGGVYDRVDGLVFVAPFYIMVLKLIY